MQLKPNQSNFQLYKGKFTIAETDFRNTFSYDNEQFISSGTGNRKALHAFLAEFKNQFKGDGKIVCKDRASGEFITLILHHANELCNFRYKLTSLKAAVLIGGPVAFEVCANLCICTW